MRFADKFQVWMVKADFIDLSTAKNDWTYNTLWNLRFGRLAGFNHSDNLDQTTELIKNMLNISFAKAEIKQENLPEIMRLTLDVEGNKKVTIAFGQKEEQISVRYLFAPEKAGGYLGFFAQTADKCQYFIDRQNFEKLKGIVDDNR